MNHIIELSSEQVANRREIKFVVSELEVENGNGCIFTEQYVNDNIESARNMLLYATFADIDKSQYTDHGEQKTDDGEYIFPDTSIVGVTTNAYVSNLTIDEIKGKYLIAEGYLQEDKVPNFIAQLKEELDLGVNPKTSVEIHAKKGNDSIIYESGKWTATNRKPCVFDFNGSAFVINPSDKNAILLELNAQTEPSDNTSQVNQVIEEVIPIEQNTIIEDEVKEELSKQVKEKVIVKSKVFELNELSYDDIATIVCRAFNATMNIREPEDYKYYYPYKFYPQSQTVIMTDYGTPQNYYKTSYNVTNNDVTIGDIVEVEQAWTPLNDEPSIEVNSSLIKDILSKKKDKGGKEKMDEKQIAEINAKLDDLTARLTDSDSKIVESNTKIDELNSTVTELNSTIVEANKTIEAKATELNSMTEELNSLKAFKEAKDIEAQEAEAQARIAEINTYFEVEIKKNGFSEVELNTLKTEYVEKNDMEGLKAKEAELCVKRVKELNSLKTNVENVELNSKQDNNDLFMAIHNTEKSEEDISDLF